MAKGRWAAAEAVAGVAEIPGAGAKNFNAGIVKVVLAVEMDAAEGPEAILLARFVGEISERGDGVAVGGDEKIKCGRIRCGVGAEKSDGAGLGAASVIRGAVGGAGALEAVAVGPDGAAGDGKGFAAILGNDRGPGVGVVPEAAKGFGVDDFKGRAGVGRCREGG